MKRPVSATLRQFCVRHHLCGTRVQHLHPFRPSFISFIDLFPPRKRNVRNWPLRQVISRRRGLRVSRRFLLAVVLCDDFVFGHDSETENHCDHRSSDIGRGIE